MEKKLKNKLAKDIETLWTMDAQAAILWNPDLKERRLTFEELAKVIHAGKNDIDIIFSPNTKSYWL